MLTSKIVCFFKPCILQNTLVDGILFQKDVSRPDRLSSAEIASIAQAAGLQGK